MCISTSSSRVQKIYTFYRWVFEKNRFLCRFSPPFWGKKRFFPQNWYTLRVMWYMLHTNRFLSSMRIFWDQVEVCTIFLWFFRIFWNFRKTNFSHFWPFCFHQIATCWVSMDSSHQDASFETKFNSLRFFCDFLRFFEFSKFQFFAIRQVLSDWMGSCYTSLDSTRWDASFGV